MSEEKKQYLKEHLYSAGVTFVSSFLTTLATTLALVQVNDLSGKLILSLIAAALVTAGRTAGKLLFQDLLKTDVMLGVRK